MLPILAIIFGDLYTGTLEPWAESVITKENISVFS